MLHQPDATHLPAIMWMHFFLDSNAYTISAGVNSKTFHIFMVFDVDLTSKY